VFSTGPVATPPAHVGRRDMTPFIYLVGIHAVAIGLVLIGGGLASGWPLLFCGAIAAAVPAMTWVAP
jgi:hypothetical protein